MVWMSTGVYYLLLSLQLFFFATYPVMVGNFRGFKFFMKQAKIRVSEIFAVLIFTVGESGTCRLASCTAKKAE